MHKYVSTFYSYKEATRQVTEWIQSHALQALQFLLSSEPQALPQHDELFGFLTVKAPQRRKQRIAEFDKMLDALTLSAHHVEKEFGDLPKVLSACDRAIKLRAESNEYYELKSLDPAVQDSNVRHRHFIAAMKRWRRKLQLLGPRPARSNSAQSLEQPFAVLAVDETPPSSDGSEDKAGESTGMPSVIVGDQCTQLITTTTTDGALQLAELTIDDFDDIVFVLQCMLVDLEHLMHTVSNEWVSVRNGLSNYVQASSLLC